MQKLSTEQGQWNFYDETHENEFITLFKKLSRENKDYAYNNVLMLFRTEQQERNNDFSIVRRTV